MRWLLHGGTKTRAIKNGRVLDEHCPECKELTRLREVEVTTSAGAWFIDVVSTTDRAFQCSACGEVFDLRDDDAAAAPALPPARAAQPAPRDLMKQLESERQSRAAADQARDAKVEDELAALKRRLGK